LTMVSDEPQPRVEKRPHLEKDLSDGFVRLLLFGSTEGAARCFLLEQLSFPICEGWTPVDDSCCDRNFLVYRKVAMPLSSRIPYPCAVYVKTLVIMGGDFVGEYFVCASWFLPARAILWVKLTQGVHWRYGEFPVSQSMDGPTIHSWSNKEGCFCGSHDPDIRGVWRNVPIRHPPRVRRCGILVQTRGLPCIDGCWLNTLLPCWEQCC